MGSRDIMNYVVVCGGIYCCIGVYTSNDHPQQGHVKFVLQSEGV